MIFCLGKSWCQEGPEVLVEDFYRQTHSLCIGLVDAFAMHTFFSL